MIFVKVNLLFTDSNSLLQPEKEQQQQQQQKTQKGYFVSGYLSCSFTTVLTGTTQTAVNMVTV